MNIEMIVTNHQIGVVNLKFNAVSSSAVVLIGDTEYIQAHNDSITLPVASPLAQPPVETPPSEIET